MVPHGSWNRMWEARGGGDLQYFIFIDSIAVCVYIRHELTNVGSF